MFGTEGLLGEIERVRGEDGGREKTGKEGGKLRGEDAIGGCEGFVVS